MDKKYCDICGKEIKRPNETWQNTLKANDGNKRVSFDETINEICEECATVIHCCTSMMKQGMVPVFDVKDKSKEQKV